MLASTADPHFASPHRLQVLRGPRHSNVHAFALLSTLKALVYEAMPQQRGLTPSQKVLLRALFAHLEAAARDTDISKDGDIGVHARVAQDGTRLVDLLLAKLTPAEREIVRLLRLGWSNKEIAYMLDKSVRTVKTQLTSVYRKFAVPSRGRLLAELARGHMNP